MDNFKAGDKVVCIHNGLWYSSENGHGHNLGPKYGQVLVIITVRKNGYLSFGDKFQINGVDQNYDPRGFVPVIEDTESEKEYRVVEVEIDKSIKEKREEVIFNN